MYPTTIHKMIEPAIIALGYELLGCIHAGQGQHGVLRIYIDSPKGIDLKDCEQVSRQVSAILDVEDPITSSYRLEVSSPGIDRPLFSKNHYQRHIGERIRLKLTAPHNGQRQFQGILHEVKENSIIINTNEEMIELALINITKANLVPHE